MSLCFTVVLVLVPRRTYNGGKTNHCLRHKQQQGSVLIDSMDCEAVATVPFAEPPCLPWEQFPKASQELIPHHPRQCRLVVAFPRNPHSSLLSSTRASVSKGVSVYRGISTQGQRQITHPEAFLALEWGWDWSLWQEVSPVWGTKSTPTSLFMGKIYSHIPWKQGMRDSRGKPLPPV